MNLASFRYFLEVAKYKSFSQAAKSLYISQPALSQQISSLEKELDIKLLQRTTKSVTLTEEGRYLYTKLRPYFEKIEKTIQDIKKSKRIPNPKIKVATTPSAASMFFPAFFQEIKTEFPGVEFHLHETTSSKAIDLINSEEYHLALIQTPLKEDLFYSNKLNMTEINKSPFQLAVSIHHPLAISESVELHKTKNELFIHYDREQAASLYFLMEAACNQAGFHPRTLCSVSEFSTVVSLVSNNIGISLIPKDVAEMLDTDKIRILNITNPKIFSTTSAVWKKGSSLPGTSKKLLNFLGKRNAPKESLLGSKLDRHYL